MIKLQKQNTFNYVFFYDTIKLGDIMKRIVYLALTILFLVFSIGLIYVFDKNTDKCKKNILKTSYNDGEVFLYCINTYDKKELKTIIEKKESKELIEYKDNAKIYKTNSYAYLVCTNKNIVIGDVSLKYTEGLCK